jgi:uncharacterized RDD family membrane protein YckC
MRADTDEQWFDSDRRCGMITPRTVFRYSTAASVGVAAAAPIIAWVLSVARVLTIFAFLSFVLGLICIIGWFHTGEPWFLIYLSICAAVFVPSMLPLLIGAWFFCRYIRPPPSTNQMTEVDQNHE